MIIDALRNIKYDSKLQGIIGDKATTLNKTFSFVFNDAISELVGIQYFAWDSNKLDNMHVVSYYNTNPDPEDTPTYKRYKKFAKSFYIAPNQLTDIILFPTAPKKLAKFEITYNFGPVTTNDVHFFINAYKFTREVKIDTGAGAEGEDW